MAVTITAEVTDPTQIPTPDQLSGAVAYRDLALDDDGDVYLDGNGDIAGDFGIDGVKSDLLSRLNTFLGEYTWNMAIGLAWRQEILGERPTTARLQELLRAETLKTPGVTTFDNFTATGSGRTLSMSFRAGTDLGQVITVSIIAQQSEEN